jgi:hypothetical protein
VTEVDKLTPRKKAELIAELTLEATLAAEARIARLRKDDQDVTNGCQEGSVLQIDKNDGGSRIRWVFLVLGVVDKFLSQIRSAVCHA